MRVSHGYTAVFDDPNLVSCSGLAPILEVAERAGLQDLRTPHRKGYKPTLSVSTQRGQVHNCTRPGLPDCRSGLSVLAGRVEEFALCAHWCSAATCWAGRNRVPRSTRGANMSSPAALLDIARAELGAHEEPPESDVTKYGQFYGLTPAAWCAEFACSYVWMRAGLVVPGDADTPARGWASVQHFLNSPGGARLGVARRGAGCGAARRLRLPPDREAPGPERSRRPADLAGGVRAAHLLITQPLAQKEQTCPAQL